MTSLVGYGSLHNINIEVTGGICNDANLKQDVNMTGDSGISSERQSTGNGVRIKFGIREKPIGHESKSKVHSTGLTSSNFTGGYRSFTDDFSSVFKESRTIAKLETNSVRVFDAEASVNRDIEDDSQPEYIEREIEILERNGVHGSDRTLGFENCESEYEQNDT